MKSKMLFLSFIAFWLFTYDALGQDRFLTYPLEQSINAIIRSGWYYDDYYEGEVLHSCELHLPSGAIDYDENVIGGQASFKIIAACEGIVVISGWSDSYGWRVVLKHTLSNGHIYFTAYTHLNEEPYLNEGDVVLRNQFIGNAGTTGNSSGVHLHFEVRHYEGQTPEQATWATSSAVDPYDKYRRADGHACGGGEDTTPYPSPTNGVSGRMGSSYLWTTDVPSYSNINYSGHYSDGWHSNGTSQAILTVYNQNSTNIGFPFDNGRIVEDVRTYFIGNSEAIYIPDLNSQSQI